MDDDPEYALAEVNIKAGVPTGLFGPSGPRKNLKNKRYLRQE